MGTGDYTQKLFGRNPGMCSDGEIYAALLTMANDAAEKRVPEKGGSGKKKLYYLSAEFLIGRLLTNNLMNLGLYESVKAELEKYGKNLSAIEELEHEPSLGNGGMGRLAACFLDSIATLGLPGDGVGLNYHLGLFRQTFEGNLQREAGDSWIETPSWLRPTDVTCCVPFGGFQLRSRMYDIDVVGFHGRTNKLHLFDVETADESIVGDGISFDKTDVKKNLTLFLYPDDSDDSGRMLRVYQEYFLACSAAHLLLDEAAEKGCNFYDLENYVVIQINDTHPTMIIPELIRQLLERGLTMEEAIGTVSRCCAYTNHTIMAEALETWPCAFLEKAVPQLMPILRELHNRAVKLDPDPAVAIIDGQRRVHMAYIDLHYAFSVNGVARLHTEILKNTELHRFYELYPQKFNNKTNGITFRRWLVHCNPELTAFLESLIGPGFQKDANELERLAAYRDDPAVLNGLLDVKKAGKRRLCEYLRKTQGLKLDADSVFDMQVKRMHEYKRQHMNALYVIDKYFAIKAGERPARKITVIFGGKAAPSYVIAKDMIHLILCLQQLTASDPDVSPYLQVAMVENYNITLAEKLVPACDVSEQISLASKEASGTSNMKFMLNGAVTLGTMDGANVEINERVGADNIYIFGASSKEVVARYAKGDYSPRGYYENDPRLHRALDFLVSREMLSVGREENLRRLYQELTTKDWFMTLPDFESYRTTRDRALADYENRMDWARKMLVNISRAGFFSSDRTIEQYNREIWKLGTAPSENP